MTSRLPIENWLSQHCSYTHIQALPGDASFRRYFRVYQANSSYIAMDASNEKKSCIPFVAISHALRQLGLNTPDIIAQEIDAGFLLLTDFGDDLYLKKLTAQNAKPLYSCALQALATLQHCHEVPGWTLTLFDAAAMRNELNLFREWFLEKHLGLELLASTQTMLDDTFDFLAETAAKQPQVFVHRDFHSANLLCLPDDQVGILDFQDAFIGPLTYDLVSLLRDCYITWPEKFVMELAKEYWQQLTIASLSWSAFQRDFDLMGVQRHLKALLTFSRKFRRDGNAGYLQHVPRTLEYVLMISARYPELHELNIFLQAQVIEKCVE